MSKNHFKSFLRISVLYLFLFPIAISAQDAPTTLKEAIVEAFMAARTLEHNVEARKLMTANLEDDYLHNKRLSIRVRSGRVVAFNFDPTKITPLEEKEFQVEVESLWADLNEQVFATQYERLKFVKVKDQWLADKIEFIKSVPNQKLIPLNVESEKHAKSALAVVKKFMKALVNRNLKLVTQYITQEFQKKFSGQEELEQFLTGPSNPYYAAYDLRGLVQKNPKEMEVKVGLYLVQKGKKGGDTTEARLTLKEGKTDWNIEDFKVETSRRSVSPT